MKKEKVNIPDNIKRHVKKVQILEDEVHLFFNSRFQLDFIKNRYANEIRKKIPAEYKILYKTKDDKGLCFDKKTKEVFKRINSKHWAESEELLGIVLFLINNERFNRCIKGLENEIKNKTKKEGVDEQCRSLLEERRNEPPFSIFKNILEETCKKVERLAAKNSKEVIKFSQEQFLYSWLEDIANQRFKKEKEYGHHIVDRAFITYPPIFYRMPQWLMQRIFNMCSEFGLRDDIFGDFILYYALNRSIYVPSLPDLYNKKIPPARILFYEDDDFPELKIKLYHDSKLPELKKFIEDNWDKIEKIQKTLLPEERWRSKKSENIQRDWIIFRVYNQTKGKNKIKKALDLLKENYDIEISADNLRTINKRIKEEEKRLNKYLSDIMIERLEDELKDLKL